MFSYWDADTTKAFDEFSFVPDTESLKPVPLSDADAFTAMTDAHPELVQLQIKTKHLDLSKALAFENLKPGLNLSYHYLFNSTNLDEATFKPIDNHKISLSINTSLLLRKERAKFQLTKIKIQDNQYKTQYKRRAIQNKIEGAFNKLSTYQRLLAQQQGNVTRYQKMMAAESDRFAKGFSDVFRVNYRENKLLDARGKLIRYQQDTSIAYLKLLWTTGTLVDF